jgi:hypothetical protein
LPAATSAATNGDGHDPNGARCRSSTVLLPSSARPTAPDWVPYLP